jgi:hypothetical protein
MNRMPRIDRHSVDADGVVKAAIFCAKVLVLLEHIQAMVLVLLEHIQAMVLVLLEHIQAMVLVLLEHPQQWLQNKR